MEMESASQREEQLLWPGEVEGKTVREKRAAWGVCAMLGPLEQEPAAGAHPGVAAGTFIKKMQKPLMM